jgi:hypothetical protein
MRKMTFGGAAITRQQAAEQARGLSDYNIYIYYIIMCYPDVFGVSAVGSMKNVSAACARGRAQPDDERAATNEAK